jgi:4a-hydroxytetrahydrobiopterin dehydratase
MDDLNLLSKKCVPCEGGSLPLGKDAIEKLLTQVAFWEVLNDKKLRRDFEFKNFKEAIDFVNKVAGLAESEGHHPDILIYGWNKVRIELWTHAIGGLSENDFILAAKIDALI